MPAIVARPNDFFHKPEFLEQITRIGNAATVKDLRLIAKQLRAGVNLLEIHTAFNPQRTKRADLAHVEKDWLHPEKSWWAEAEPEKKLRKGFLKAISLQIKNRTADGKPLPVDYWWSPKAEKGFNFVTLLGPGQLTVVLVTPRTPSPNVRRGGKRSAAAAPAAKAAKAPTKKAAKKKG
ncbi:MAG: hypothetical protein RL701_1960 [Pseudomonadota bacterium]|jgi:hypothetical protein